MNHPADKQPANFAVPRVWLCFALIAALSLPAGAAAGGGAARQQLTRFFAEVQSWQANFSQSLYDEGGRLLEQSSGEVFLLRPGRFRWNYAPPNQQHIISDGRRITVYDPELEQATIRSLAESLGQVPTLVLVGDGADLDEYFSVEELGMEGELDWLSVKPLQEDAGYEELRLGFRGSGLAGIQLVDGLGQLTLLTFNSAQENAPVTEQMFDFVPPRGVDVLRED